MTQSCRYKQLGKLNYFYAKTLFWLIHISVRNFNNNVKQQLETTVNHVIPNILINFQYWTESLSGVFRKTFSENMQQIYREHHTEVWPR